MNLRTYVLAGIICATVLDGSRAENRLDNSEQLVRVPAIPLANPDRGYHIECRYWAADLQNKFSPGNKYPELFIDESLCELDACGDGITLVQQYIYLTEYIKNPCMPESAINNIRLILQGIRDHGYKAILRFAYNWGTGGNETKDVILHHIAQLKPVIREYLGNIATIQMGFMGAWGEWHSTPICGDADAMCAVVNATLDAYPSPYCIEMRLPEYKNALKKGKPVINDEEFARIGFNNDYFTAGGHPKAPGNDFVPGDDNYSQSMAVAPFCFMSGEIPYNENTEWGLSTLIDRKQTLICLRDNHYSALDISQNNELNIRSWKEHWITADNLIELGILFDKSYFVENGKEVARSFYDFVRDHLGYRINVKDVSFDLFGNCLNYRIDLTNTGFATVVNPKDVYLVLISDKDQIVQKIKLDVNPKDWQPYAIGKKEMTPLIHSLSGKIKLEVKPGNYKIGVWMPEVSGGLEYDSRFAVKFAPSDKVTLWNDKDGKYAINIIGLLELGI